MRQFITNFYGKDLLAVQDDQGRPWVSVRHVCDGIRIDSARQRDKIESDSRFSWRHMSSTAADGIFGVIKQEQHV